MSWVEEEAANIERERETRQQARKMALAIANYAAAFWGIVRELVQSDIKEINRDPRFTGNPRGKLIFEDCNGWAFSIGRGFDTVLRVEYPTHDSSDDRTPIRIFRDGALEVTEELHFALSTDGSDALCVKNKAGVELTYREVSKYLLKPLLR